MKPYEIVVNKVIESMEKGVAPWQKSWGFTKGAAKNYVTGKPYRGVNVLTLWCNDWQDNRYLTYKQAQELGGSVRRGEKGTPILFWTKKEEEMDNGETKEWFTSRYYTVFNVAQIDGITISPLPEIASVDFKFLLDSSRLAPVVFGGGDPRYNPNTDTVYLPNFDDFSSKNEAIATLSHEIIHSTGHSSRLNRNLERINFAGDHHYSEEELIAELGSVMVCSRLGIESTTDSSAAYLDFWLKKIKENPRALIRYASQAQKACDYVFNEKI